MKALVMNGVVIDIEKRDIDVYNYYHKDIATLFIECPDDTEVGFIHKNGEFIKTEAVME